MANINSKQNIKASNYVKASIDFLNDINLLNQFYQSLLSLQNILNYDSKIKALFLSPLIEAKVKKELLEELLTKKFAHKKIMYFFDVLIGNNDLKFLDKITEKLFLKMLEFEKKNLMQIITAIELDESYKDRIEKTIYLLNEQASQKIYLTYQVDEGIKGGYIIYFKNKIYDVSLKKKFNTVKRIINELITV